MEYPVIENIRITDNKNEIDLDKVHHFLKPPIGLKIFQKKSFKST